MIINKNFNKNNSKIITEKYLEWLNSGVRPSDILVLTFSSISKRNILNNILKLTEKKVVSDLKITTFNGLIYNVINDYWGEIENDVHFGNSVVIPHLTGLEVSQYLLKQILKDEPVKGYNSKKSLLHQIFRRYSLIVNNNLSQDEVKQKSNLLKEAFGEDADRIITKYKTDTLKLRAFDNLRQAQVFGYIYKNTAYFKNIKYLIVEDADEMTPLCLDFLKTLSTQLNDKLIILDKNGGSRCGYLCAEPKSADVIEKIFNEKFRDTENEPENVVSLRNNILDKSDERIKNMSISSFSKRLDMIEYANSLINDLINEGNSPNDIALVTPLQDNMLRFTLKSGLKNCNPIFVTGSDKLSDNSFVKAILSILKLSINISPDEYELRIILSKYLGIPVKVLDSKLVSNNCYSDKYDSFFKFIDELKVSKKNLSEKAFLIYSKFKDKATKSDIKKVQFFLKELQEFEKVFKNNEPKNFEEDIITQIENSIIYDNPYSNFELEHDDIIVSTPQKIVDNKIKTKYQIWLDISSQEWTKPDIGPLYNSWVFQKSWESLEYTLEDNVRESELKTFKILRKLLLSTDKVIALSALFDTQGVENFGGIDKYLVSEEDKDVKDSVPKFKIVPRDDQKPVLDYEQGQMAISAVPGAGKTTILLALIIELLKKDIEPENIYVLTYMESAARNFKDRIKMVNGNSSKIPNISTIHGLALRILKENSNYERIGLNPEFEICDDTQRGRILKSLSETIQKQELEEFDRAISVMKFSEINLEDNQEITRILNLKKGDYTEMKLKRFLNFFFDYKQRLETENLIDYDDILISSVKLLETNKDILEYYRNECQYIIEDEAQDSSSIQQRLINLLSAKHKNLIRCGDINQAITTTFTNADIEGFKEFIETSSIKVDMDCSQRCAEGVWKLANKLVKWGNSKQSKPFYEIYMKPVEGKNPKETDSVKTFIYKTSAEEKNSVVKEIRNILNINPDATIGVLLRNNYQVNSWADYINNAGLTAITRNECLAQKRIFRVIFSVLKAISNPYDNNILANAYKILAECGILKPHLEKCIESFGLNQDETSKLVFDNSIITSKSFISLDNDNISNPDLSKFHWDMNYWLSFPEMNIDELATMIGMYYFSKDLDRSNIHLISTLCSKLNNGNFNQTIQRLEELSNRPNLSGFKFFSEEDDKDLAGGKIQLMTLHKSKGDEFDYVFLPEMSEKNLQLNTDRLKLKKTADFTERIKSLNPSYTPKTEQELKDFLINENYRLLYVAITRAKRRLYISTSKTETYFGKQKETTPSEIFNIIQNLAVF